MAVDGPGNCRPAHLGRPGINPVPEGAATALDHAEAGRRFNVTLHPAPASASFHEPREHVREALERAAAVFRANAPALERLARMQTPAAPPITPAILHPMPSLAEFLEMPKDVRDALRAEIARDIAADNQKD